ncbi:Rv2231c family pyridoxal phosphate-dependent protein CobC [Corynebacterium epidermidicanis]|uniref:Putative aminotransferase n=1 Tax=Corynebacterium epidermidicanis TaxID=1050174 RepID=A0A0G3GR34_9CORY|nr:Rv2231c family pyridoxal phosphate-dependent protein CobC [Corynebacterium epidermidicanis]AKK03604.1 putative aminotransferase [Corynebacterium epidermidicanis]
MSAFDPYRFHGDIDAAHAKVDFAVNVRGNRPPEWLQRVLIDAVGDLAAYPSAADVATAESAVAKLHGVPTQSVLLLAGASEGFALLPKLAPKQVAIIHPGFTEPNAVFQEAGIAVRNVVLPPPFELTGVEDLGDADLVVIGNPTNPTGVVHDPADLLQLGKGRTLVVDEAFLDVSSESDSLATEAASRRDVIVLRSFTKTWAIAGLRCGYLIAHPDTISLLRRGRAQWPLGTLQLRAIAAIAERGAREVEIMGGVIAAERIAMTEALGRAGFEIASATQAPYVLVRPPTADPEATRRRLLAGGIAVRRCDTFPGLDSSYWRLAVRPADQVAKLLREL